jgi:hypothetical protein
VPPFIHLFRHPEIAMRRLSAVLCVVAAASASSVVAAGAQQGRTQVGILECRSGPNVGMIVGSVSNFGCVFRAEGRPDDLYVATVTKLGLDIGITNETVLSWAVFAPTREVGRGDLSGNYAGVNASAAIGVGLGANAMVGGSANSFALQPLSVQGQTGLSASGGVQSMELRPGR